MVLEDVLNPSALRGSKREGAAPTPRARKGKPMADMEKPCGDCDGKGCSKCSSGKKKYKRNKTPMDGNPYAKGFKMDLAQLAI